MLNFETQDEGCSIAVALKQGTAIAVCDGSYKPHKGASAWVIEGHISLGRIRGWNHVPGDEMDQSAYVVSCQAFWELLQWSQ